MGEGLTRIWLWALLAAGVWALAVYGQSRPIALGLEAPVASFSAARADAALADLLGPERPHPVGSAENAALQARLLKALAARGVPAQTRRAMSCFSEPRLGAIECGAITNIVAQAMPGAGPQILLVAHDDSVAAGPGAADDGSGVAILLETIRALKARGSVGAHPVTALFSDGEEAGMLGAAAYLQGSAARADIGAVINVEARGNQGPSYLFQTGSGAAPLIDLYAKSVSHFAATSLSGVIYKYLPNDTDLTPFLDAGFTGYNFAFIGNAAQYHTPLDTRAHLDPRSLQQQGENVLELTDGLARADLSKLRGGEAIYLDVLGRWLPRLPQRWALVLSVIAFLVIALTGLAVPRERRTPHRPVLAALMPPLLLGGCVGMGFVLHGLAAWISGHDDPSFAHPVYLRLSLAFGVWAVALLAARRAGATTCWLWLAGLAIASAMFLPGATPYFLFPALVAAPALVVTVRGARKFALVIAALAGLVIWIGLAANSEPIMGLKLHMLFMGSVAFGLIALLPVLAKERGAAWGVSLALSLVLAIALAVTAGLQPAYSVSAPQSLNLRYVERAGKAYWLADPVPRLPESLRAVAKFSDVPERVLERGYVAPAGLAQFPPPAATISRKGGEVLLDVNAVGDGVLLVVPKEAALQAVSIGGVTTAAPRGDVVVFCATPDCARARIGLRLASPQPVSLLLIAQRRGLPRAGAPLLKARPIWAVPSQEGDMTLLAAKVAVPGG